MNKPKETRELGIISIILGLISIIATIILAFIPVSNSMNSAIGGFEILSFLGLIFGIISIIKNRKNKKRLSTIGIILSIISILSLITLSGWAENKSNDLNENITASNSSDTSDSDTVINSMSVLAKEAKSTNEIYVTDDLSVGKDKDVKPGIYDLEILGGNGNISGYHKILSQLFINWAVSQPNTNSDSPSKIRMILTEGDHIKFSNISKIKFTAVHESTTSNNELGIGEYIVGRDIDAGTYKLSTNVTMDSQFDNLGWDIDIYDVPNESTKSQTLNPSNSDVAVKLKKGDIISTSFTPTNNGTTADNTKLIFTPTD